MEKNTSKLNETAKTPAKKSKKPAKSKKPEKTVSAKKLPGIFKKTYKEKAYSKNLLKKFYIEADKKFVEKLYSPSQDKKGRNIMVCNKSAEITKADLKRYKLIAKQIKMQKGGIKLVPLIAVAVLVAVLSAGVSLFKNIIIEKAITSAMQGIFGAKTDIAKVDFQFFNASLEINGLEQANKDSPMKNLFQIDSIKTSFNLTDLLRGKFHAENLSVEGVAIDTERKKSGELPIKPAKTKEEKQTENALSAKKQELSEEASAKLKEMFDSYNPEKMLENLQNELKSPAVASQISTDVQQKVEKWSSLPAELQEKVNAFSKNVNDIANTDFSKINDVAKLKSTLEKINSTAKSGEELKKLIEKSNSDLFSDSKAIADYSNKIQTAIKSDYALVDSKISEMKSVLSPAGLNEIMTNAVQSVLYQMCGKYYPYVSKGLNAALSAQKSSSEKETEKSAEKTEKTVMTRHPGRTVFFKQDTVPTLFIENVTASGYEYKTDNLLFKGNAKNIANNQNMTGKPTDISADFKIAGNPNNASVKIDARTNTNSPLVTASYTGSGIPVNADAQVFAFTSKSTIKAKMTADTNGKVSLNGVLDMNISEMTGMQFDVEKISELYNTALSNISRLTVDFSIGINEDKTMTISLNNLDSLASQLTTPVVKTLTAELNSIAADARSSAAKLLSEKTGVATEKIEQFTNIKNSVNSSKESVNNLQKKLEQKKKQINDQITNSTKAAAGDAAGNLIKKLF
ncbi:MAG: TIGR03545 family protein [Treponema porcinum]|uniref:TIGR03545 family protein n=1 Tax=Treponema porcinum TaxID=261392 RepID=UPI002354FE78|nr:TIGR03545 family protein [Treponema porcinum]MCI6482321.1 TIGR03545 family protein [Treponema porcinum]MDY5120998.1 TIGR03545 family protein [Treponema porcinum]